MQSILLGIVQGLTEFLPISSSAHLVIVPYLFGWKIPAEEAFVFNVLVQVATLVAVFTYFWNDLVCIGRAVLTGLANRRPFADPQASLGWYLVLATIPAGVIGFALRGTIEEAFSSPAVTALFLLGTAGFLLVAEWAGRRRRSLECLNWKDALWIGFFQAIALFPGISRSGATITGGMMRDLERPTAARFSFLLSIPIMLAAGVFTSIHVFSIPNLSHLLPVFIPGFITSGVVGYLSIRWLLSFLVRRPLIVFSVYCVLLSLVTLGAGLAGH